MFLEFVFSKPTVAVIWVAVILISLGLHEFSHAVVARVLGDKTGESRGRLSPNPFAHIDPVGLVVAILFGFGWAKPVPFDAQQMKHSPWDSVAVAVAGPFANLVIAVLASGALVAVSALITSPSYLVVFLFLLVVINLLLFFFNLIPVHPFDGSKFVFAFLVGPQFTNLRTALFAYGPKILLGAIVLDAIFHFNVFGSVSQAALSFCDQLIGEDCASVYGAVLSST